MTRFQIFTFEKGCPHTMPRGAGSGFIWDVQEHEDLTFVGESGDYYVFLPPYPIVDDDWRGISGAPFLDNEGRLIGILCGELQSIFWC